MAENKQPENKPEDLKIKTNIKKIKEPDFSKQITITKLMATREMTTYHFNRMKKEFGDKMTDQDIWARIYNMVVQDNIFNEAMHIIVPCYEITIAPEEISKMIEGFYKQNPQAKDAPRDYVEQMVRRMIEKELIFAVLAKEWKIEVSDQEVKDSLDAYYKATNNPIRDILNDPKQLEGIKKSILDQKVFSAMCSKLKYTLDNKAIQENAEKSRKEYEERMAKIRAEAEAKTKDQPKPEAKPEQK